MSNKESIQQEIHYNDRIWVHTIMDTLRHTECLCLNCDKKDTCDLAQILFNICRNNDLALAVTRCPLWQ